jgi:hypothetical protein
VLLLSRCVVIVGAFSKKPRPTLGFLAAALGLNDPETPDSCLGVEFSLAVDVDLVLVGSLHRDLEQLGDQSLRQPHGAALQANLEVGAPS